jgi:light-regulated signal transduction histidine kinase (bacteriophytochrome)
MNARCMNAPGPGADNADDNLSTQLRHARDLAAELEAFSYSVSHDLRAPLDAIRCFAQSVRETEAVRMSTQGRHRLERVIQGALRMNRMIDDLLGCSRTEHCEMFMREVDLGMLAAQAAGELMLSYPRARIQIDALPRTMVDPALLRQVLENLVGNALKFSARVADPRVRIDAVDLGTAFEIRVHDNGVGFDAEYASRLFCLFQRLHRDEEFAGTGVGLAIVKRVVARHGGTVRAESKPNVRTTFAFTLPKKAAGASTR